MILFVIKNVGTLVMFAAGIYSAMKVAHPSYFKPARWLHA